MFLAKNYCNEFTTVLNKVILCIFRKRSKLRKMVTPLDARGDHELITCPHLGRMHLKKIYKQQPQSFNSRLSRHVFSAVSLALTIKVK